LCAGRTCRRPPAVCSGWRAGLKPGAYRVHGFARGWANHRTLLLTWTRRAPVGLLRGQHRPARFIAATLIPYKISRPL
jgi:hypothetical protein